MQWGRERKGLRRAEITRKKQTLGRVVFSIYLNFRLNIYTHTSSFRKLYILFIIDRQISSCACCRSYCTDITSSVEAHQVA